MTAEPTQVQTLRALSDDRARGLWCLGKAEQCRHAYELGRRQSQELAAGASTSTRSRRTAVSDVSGAAIWAASPAAKDLAEGDRMYTSWAVAYFAAYQAAATAGAFVTVREAPDRS